MDDYFSKRAAQIPDVIEGEYLADEPTKKKEETREWPTVNVEPLKPIALFVLELPMQLAARKTGKQEYLFSPEQKQELRDQLDSALPYLLDQLGAHMLANPLISLGMATGMHYMANHAAVQMAEAINKAKQSQNTKQDSSKATGRTAESEGESPSSESQEAENHSYS